MKKLHLLFAALFCVGLASAQTSETKLFTGDATPSMFSRVDIVTWGMGDAAANYVNYGTAEAPAFTEVTDNPVKTGLNETSKALHLTSMKGHSWWPDFLNFSLTDPITVTESNRYLHFYHYRENLNKGFSVNINKEQNWEDPDKGTKRFDMNLTTPGKWEDIVVDLKWFMDNNTPVTNFTVIMDTNWGGESEPLTNYYFDEIVLNNSNLPRGLNIMPDKTMSLFYGNTDLYTKWVKQLDNQNGENASAIVANPFTTETATLNSTNVVKFDKSANASWWQGLRTVMNGVVKVGVNDVNYLHVMVNIPTMEAGNDYYVVQLNAKDFSGNQIDNGESNKYWSTDAGKWVDMVMDVSSLGYVQEFTVRFDVRRDASANHINSPAGTFYMDAVSIDSNPDPRTAVDALSAVNNHLQSSVKAYSSNNRLIVEGNVASIEVFNMLGKSVSKTATTKTRSEVALSKGGAYLAKVVTTEGKVFNFKVLIK